MQPPRDGLKVMRRFLSPVEFRHLIRLGLPILLGMLAQIGMNFVDTLMAGRYSADALAGVGVANSLWSPVIMLAVGLLLALPSMSAQLVGAGRPERAAYLLRQGMAVSVLLSAVVMTLLWFISGNMAFFHLDPAFEPVARDYLRALLPGVPPFLFFINLRSFLEGFNRTRPAMFIALACLVLNIPCNWIFIYGHFGMPELGGAGCGVATSICFWFRFLAMLGYLHRDRELGRYSILHGWLPAGTSLLEPGLVAQVCKVGAPNALALSLETLLFAVSALLLAPLGSAAVAAHQIVLSYENLVFTLPLAVNMTVAIRTGHCLGAGRLRAARIAARTALLLGVMIAMTCTMVTIACREYIAGLYSTEPDVLALAAGALFICGLLQLPDTTQGICAGVLRGYNDTRFISITCLFACTVPGLGLGWLLARTDVLVPAMGTAGFWTAYIPAMGLCAAAYLGRMHWLHSLSRDAVRARLAR